jgi:cyclopropane-fatty-acyl-phospholipid synthase
MAAGDIGFAEAYIAGEWETPDLTAFLYIFCVNHEAVATLLPGRPIIKWVQRIRHWLNRNTKSGARRNIHAHYDLGNAFYSAWLDRTMTYSAAIFAPGDNDLASAQTRKYRTLAKDGGFKPGDHVLEIGCGWGGFAEYAARERGLRVTGLTISQAQYDYAVERIARAGLSDRVEIKLQDYRDERGVYDGIASIEMFEAVGEKYWPTYFATLRNCLKPGRHATLQIITVPDARWHIYKRGVDFIQKYIFPGGMLPAPGVLRAEVERAGLAVRGSIEFGESYSQTLRRWHETFNHRWDEVKRLGFDDRFKRMWDFYLASCAGAFAGGNCDVTQITVTRPPAR